MPPSIKDIARRAGLAHSTVSRALRDNPVISAETRARVKALAEEMGYRPNTLARGLRAQRTHTVAFVVASFGDPYFARLIRGFETEAERLGLTVLLSSSHRRPERERGAVDLFRGYQVDGVALASTAMDPGTRHALEGLPTVLVNPEAEGPLGLPTIAVDNRAGARVATEHLIELGHRHIVYLGVRSRPATDAARQLGYRDAMSAAGLEARTAHGELEAPDASVAGSDLAEARRLLPGLVRAGATAIVAYNDSTATGVLLAARDLDIEVPGDLSVTGFDDLPIARLLVPPLTTVRQDARELGRRAMATLHELCGDGAPEDFLLATELVVRDSTSAPPSAQKATR